MNWNPGLSLFVKDGVPLAEAAPLALPPGHPSATSTTEQPQAAAAGLTTAQLAGIVVGSVVGAALLAGAAVLLWRRHRRRASGSQQQLLPTAHALAPAGAVAGAAGHPLKARASLPNELPEVHVDGGEVELASSVNRAVSTPRRRAQSSPGRGGKQPLPPPPAAAAGLVAAVDLQGTAAAVLPSPFAALAGKAPLPSGPITPGGSSSSRLTVAALLAGSSSTTPLRRQQGGQPPAAAVAGDQGGGSGEERSRGGAAAMSGPGGSASPSDEAAASIAAESGQRSQALAWVDEWEDVLVRRGWRMGSIGQSTAQLHSAFCRHLADSLTRIPSQFLANTPQVPESDIQFERDAEGRPITLGSVSARKGLGGYQPALNARIRGREPSNQHPLLLLAI